MSPIDRIQAATSEEGVHQILKEAESPFKTEAYSAFYMSALRKSAWAKIENLREK